MDRPPGTAAKAADVPWPREPADWLAFLAGAMLRPFGPEGLACIASQNLSASVADGQPLSHELGGGLLVADICLRADLEDPDDIAEVLASRHAPSGIDARSWLEFVVLPALDDLRGTQMPGPWWEVGERWDLLVHGFARRLIVDAGLDAARSVLATRFDVVGKNAEMLLTTAAVPRPDAASLLGEIPPDALGRARTLADEHPEVLAAFRASIDPRALWRTDIASIADALGLHNVVLLHGGRELRSVADALQAGIEGLLQPLCGAELGWLVARAPWWRTCVDALMAEPRHMFADPVSGRIGPMVEHVDGQLQLPRLVTDNIYGFGGRIDRRSCGPTTYWTALNEEPSEIANNGLQLALVDDSQVFCELQLTLQTTGGPQVLTFSYTDSPSDLYDLAVLVVSQTVRLDLLRRSSTAGGLTRQHRLDFSIDDDLAGAIGDRITVALSALPEADLPSAIASSFVDDPAAAFYATEHSKGEELVALIEALRGSHGPLFLAARAVLDAEAARAARMGRVVLDPDAPELTAVRAARDAWARALVDHRHAIPRGPRPNDSVMAELLRGITGDGCAVIHLNIARGGLEAVCALGPDGADVRLLNTSAIDLAAIEAALDVEPDDDIGAFSPTSFAALDEACRPLGDLFAEAADEGARRLVVSPVWRLQAVHLHALATSDGRRLCDIYEHVTYAPSLMVLRLGADTPHREGPPIVAASDDGFIPLVHSEAVAVGTMLGVDPLLQEAATPAAIRAAAASADVVHIACHGSSRRGDFWASALHLHAHEPEDAIFSVADIVGDLDLRGVRLVALSACEAGRSDPRTRDIEEHFGIDTAFLAAGARSVVSTIWEVDDAIGMLYSVHLHAARDAGATVADAHRQAVAALRTGSWRTMDDDHPVAKALGTAAPDWRKDLADREHETDLTHPMHWTNFKLAGWPDG
jgi:hypothetical protein